MNEKKRSKLLKFQLGAIMVFFIVFLIWAVNRCDAMRENYRQQLEARQAEQDSLDQLLELANATQDTLAAGSGRATGMILSDAVPILYVTIEGLKLRKEPGLQSEVLSTLGLYEEVVFLNEVSDSTVELNLGRAMATGHWVKVRSRKGHEGWVYEPGVYFYRRKHPDAF